MFDLETLKERIKGRLPGWWTGIQTAGITSVYAGFAAATLMPILDEMQRNPFGAGMLLASLTTGAFGSLIAAQLERWRGEGQTPTEATLAQWIAEQAERDVSVRDGLDDLLTKVDAAGMARQALKPADLSELLAALRRDFANVALPRFQNTLTGDGNVLAQTGPGGTAIAAQQIIMVGGAYQGPREQTREAALAIYRRVLVRRFAGLSLSGLDADTSDVTGNAKQPSLAQVYVGLDTTSADEPESARAKRAELRSDGKPRALSALRAVARTPKAVLLGDPGSGKSTFVNHLLLCLAAHPLGPSQGWMLKLPGWPDSLSQLIPIPIVLRDLAAWLPSSGQITERHLLDFLSKDTTDRNLDFVFPFLTAALDDGGALVLLDGLDEIPDRAQRERTRDAVQAFVDRYDRSRHVVTCRTLSYQDKHAKLKGFTPFQIAQFDSTKIQTFIGAWYAELEAIGAKTSQEAMDLRSSLQKAVRRPDLRRLAPNPMLLTVMAIVNTHKGRLPDARALVYRDVIDILLWRGDEKKVARGDTPVLRKLITEAGLGEMDVIRILAHLAFEAQQSSPKHGDDDDDVVADIAETALLDRLTTRYPNDKLWAVRAVEAMKLRAGLLVERTPHVFSFPHRTFQEHLAGVHLSTRGEFAKEASDLLDGGAYWLPTVLMAMGHLVHVSGEFDKALALVNRLCPEGELDDQSWRKVWFAGEALAEFGVDRAIADDVGRPVVHRVNARLVSLVRAGHLNAVERAAAITVLGRLGDPRFRPSAWFLPDDPTLGFIDIPAGSFTMGSDKRKDNQADADELKQHSVDLRRYLIGRWPVTVAQFALFATDAAREGFAPEDAGSLNGVPNHPVTRVTWHEALRYCAWLTTKLRESADTPEPLATLLRVGDVAGPWRVTLPSEAEWEKAARGPGTANAIYPWGDTVDPNKANYDDTGINTTSAVGCFPDGRSRHYGVEDLSGNVWEWTRSLWGKDFGKPTFTYPYEPDYKGESRENVTAGNDIARVVRGGAFYFNSRYVRSAYRYGVVPGYRDDGLGFRVVVSPFTSDL